MSGRRARWLTAGIWLALLAPAASAGPLVDTERSPLISTITAEEILSLPNARVAEHAFIVPSAPGCEPLRRDLFRLDVAVLVD